MMGSRGSQNDGDYEVFSRRWRRMVIYRRGFVRSVKKRFWKRERQIAKADVRSDR
jgi:hypothetical protein